MNQPLFIYFDVGGVLIKDFSGNFKWEEMKRDLGVTDQTDQAFEAAWKKIDGRVCVDYDVDDFADTIRSIPGITIPEQYSMLDDLIQRFEFLPAVWQYVETLAERFQLGLLTNMYPRMLNKIFEKELVYNRFFPVIIDSSVVGCQKPQEEIFTLAQQRAGVEASQILFVDNTLENIEAAQRVGWQTLYFNSQNSQESLKKLSMSVGIL